jgi:uncharacterized protein DUF4328
MLVGRGAERLTALSRAIQILLAIVLVMNAISAVMIVAFRSRFADYADGGLPKSDVDAAISTIGLVGIVAGGCQIALVVCVMVWMWRAARNLRVAGRVDATWAPGWAVGGWFCPPCIFVIPWLMLQELWKGSAPSPEGRTWRENRGLPLIPLWWLLYGIGGVLVASVQFGGRGASTDLDDLAEFYDSAALWTVVSTAITIAAGICFIVIVRRLTARQRALTGE